MSDAPHPEGRRLLVDGPKTIKEFNPRAILRFSDRVCETCDGPILEHYLIASSDPETLGVYWCDKEAQRFSTGLKI